MTYEIKSVENTIDLIVKDDVTFCDGISMMRLIIQHMHLGQQSR